MNPATRRVECQSDDGHKGHHARQPRRGRNGMKQGYVTRNGFVLLEAVLGPLRVHTHPLLKYPLLNVHYINCSSTRLTMLPGNWLRVHH